MSYSADDEIVAIASATGGAARGILRLSGPRVARCLQLCFQADDALDQPRVPLDGHSPETVPRAIPGSLMLKDLGSRRLPCLLYYWATPHSYTRQPVAEFHTLGSPPLLDVALLAICASGARLANPGEFTMRAFLAGRLDMTQAEAVLGVIDAGGPQSLEVALAQLAGNLARPLHQLRERLLEVLAHLEAGLDFVEEDIQFIRPEVLVGQLTEAQTAVTDLLHRMDVRSYTPDSVQVVLMGAPNVGKSSLFNALAIEGEALTAATSGTTRDYLTASISLEGMDCQLVDTAGIEDEALLARLEQQAQDQSLRQQDRAHVRLLCLDATRAPTAWERDQLLHPASCPRLVVLTKCDLPRYGEPPHGAIPTSSVTQDGLEQLKAAIREKVIHTASDESPVVAGTASRCRESLFEASACLTQAIELAACEQGEELVAAELHGALEHLGRVAGTVYTDDILDRIFSRFCIGK